MYTVLRVIAWCVCIYQVVLGIALNLPGSAVAAVAESVFGISKMPGEPTLIVARMLGAYMVAIGIGMGLAAWNPVKNRAFLSVGAILLGLRVVQRLVSFGDLQQVLGIAGSRNLTMIVVLAAFTACVIAFRLLLSRDMRADGATTGVA
jgi:hypothetical protein